MGDETASRDGDCLLLSYALCIPMRTSLVPTSKPLPDAKNLRMRHRLARAVNKGTRERLLQSQAPTVASCAKRSDALFRTFITGALLPCARAGTCL